MEVGFHQDWLRNVLIGFTAVVNHRWAAVYMVDIGTEHPFLSQVRQFLINKCPHLNVDARLVANFRVAVKDYIKSGTTQVKCSKEPTEEEVDDGLDLYFRDILSECLREGGYAFPRLLKKN